jgi:hypothetical protein
MLSCLFDEAPVDGFIEPGSVELGCPPSAPGMPACAPPLALGIPAERPDDPPLWPAVAPPLLPPVAVEPAVPAGCP